METYTVEVCYARYESAALELATTDKTVAMRYTDGILDDLDYHFESVTVKEWIDGEQTVIRRVGRKA